MRTWREAFAASWLSDPDIVGAVDMWVRRQLVQHRKLEASAIESVAPWSIRVLAEQVGAYGDAMNWMWCLAAISFLQELLFCAEGGGIEPTGIAKDADLKLPLEALKAVRNAVVHPALHKNLSGEPAPILRLLKFLGRDDDPDVAVLAMELPDDWSYLARPPAAHYALRMLNAAGRAFFAKQRLLPARNR